jgi:CheY-like chemotaxis protein
MKYKVLLSGNNRTVMNEFFTYMDFSFECMSCSDRYDDILNHIKYVNPDVFVYCLRDEGEDEIKRFANAWRRITKKSIPLAIVGDDEDCSRFEKLVPSVEALFLRKPLSSQNIETAVLKLITSKQEEKEQEEKENDPIIAAQKLLGELGIKVEDEPAAKPAQAEAQSAPASADEAPAEQEKKKPDRRRHILVVDDDSGVLKLIKNFLSEQYDVATAISGKVAVKFLEAKSTDLILLDYEMPGETGVDVLNQIRSNPKTKDIPVVFLTGVTDREKIQDVLVLKPQGYLLKPINLERLTATIKEIL